MVELPATLKIMGHEYSVRYPYKFPSTECLTLGMVDPTSQEVFLKGEDLGGNPRPDSGVIVTLIHEIMHALDIMMGYGLFTNSNGEDLPAINGMSQGIYQVLKDNGLGYLFMHDDLEFDLDELDEDDIEALKEALEKRGLTIVSLRAKKSTKAKKRG